MANGTPSDADECIIRSGVRSGLKREFAFALKSQAQLSPSLGRTRSGKPSPPPSPNSNPNTSSSVAKRFKKPSPLNPIASSLSFVETPAPAVAAVADLGSGPKLKDDDALARPMEEDEPEPIVENPISFAAVPEDAHGSSGADTASALKVTAQSTSEEASLPPPRFTEDKDGPKEDSGGSIIDIDVDFCTPENSATTPPPPLVQVIGDSVETPVKTEKLIMGTPPRRLTRSLLKGADNEKEEPQLETADSDTGDLRLPENPASRRFTRSLLKVPGEETSAGEVSANVSRCSVGPDEAKGGVRLDDGLSSISPSKKLELKMSKKIALNKLPANVRELLGTGLLEGMPVKYLFSANKPFGLQGVIKGNGILCACSLCKGSKVISAYNFEVHAGSTKKHPSDYIFLENGKSLRDVMRACTSAPLDMLESAIQNAIGVVPPTKSFTCLKCKELFHTPRSGRFAMMCDSCLEPKHNQKTMTSFRGTPCNAKLPSRHLAGDASYDLSKKISSQKNSILPTKGLTEDASDSLSKNSSTQKKLGKLTRKDLGLHKLVFMDDILPEGTEVGYYVRGKRLLDGYIKDSGIYCHCCGSVVSPSQFEAHAGRAARRKPYNNIYTSNGVSLHELSVSLSKGRKLTASENDDLCSICADGGDLLLCDQCPRAFHKECVGLSSIPVGDWYCRYCLDMHQRERSLSSNDNAIAAGRVAGVDPIEQIIKRCIRIVTTSTDIGGCVLCRCHDFSKSGFDNRTVIICDQCEKEYHVGCLKDHNMCDLKELPEDEWFCSCDCVRIHSALQQLLQESQHLQGVHADIIKKKREEKGLDKDGEIIIRWRLLSGRTCPAEVKLLLSEAVTIFHESFDPIIDAVTGRDLIPSMVYGRNVRDQDFGGMYCAVLTVNSSVVSAGILRVLGCEVAELPLVATNMESQGRGYFQSLFACIEELLQSLKVKHFVLPSADESKSIWTKKFGFSTITRDQLQEYTKGARPMVFQGTSMLYKPVNAQGSR